MISTSRTSDFQISGSAISSHKNIHPPARDELAKHGISCAGKRAVQLTRSDYEKYDFLIGMDEMNIRNMERMTGHRRGEKIFKLLEFAGRSQDVADPWYTGDFRRTYEDVADGCEGLLRYLEDSK